jgi:hypothetical protein
VNSKAIYSATVYFSNRLLEKLVTGVSTGLLKAPPFKGQLTIGAIRQSPELAVVEAGYMSISWTRCWDVSKSTVIMDKWRDCRRRHRL